LFDVQLSQLAASVTGMPLALAPGSTTIGARDAPLVVQVWNRDGVQVFRSQGPAAAPERRSPGFSTVQSPEGPWRVYSVLAQGQLIQVAQPLAQRDQLAASLALSSILPWLIAAPVDTSFCGSRSRAPLRPLGARRRSRNARRARCARSRRMMAARVTPLSRRAQHATRPARRNSTHGAVRRRRGARAAHAARGRHLQGPARRGAHAGGAARRRARRAARREAWVARPAAARARAGSGAGARHGA
jgi:hypothetical protein